MDTAVRKNLKSAENSQADPLTPLELQRAVRMADSAALLVLPRLLRRVIKEDRHLAGFAYRIPHRKSYVIDRESLLEIVDYEELGIPENEILPDKVILLAQPTPEKLAAMPAGNALLRCWRLLFHARIHLTIQQRFILGYLSPAQIQKRIHQIGEVEFDEIRAVLHQEGFLLPPRTDATIYEEFAAIFFELKYFAWNLLPRYFSGLADVERIESVLSVDIDGKTLFASTRPLGAPEPSDRTGFDDLLAWPTAFEVESKSSDSLPEEIESTDRDEKSHLTKGEKLPAIEPDRKGHPILFRRVLRRAQRPSKVGNVVRAAIWRTKALRYAPADLIARTKASIRDDLNRLVIRLQAALEREDETPPPWADALRSLVDAAAEGFWTPEGRLLYDLQKVCVDHEREIYSVDLIGKLRSLTWAFVRRVGKWFSSSKASKSPIHPLKRPLPNQRDVLKSQHLRSAQRRLTAVRLSETQRKELGELLRSSIAQIEVRLRQRFRPFFDKTFDEVGMTPGNYPEQIARDKLIEELLDQIVEHGYLSMGHVRDALSRNNLKLPDFRGVNDLYYGDPLLKADRRLNVLLRGVYRPADIYMRWLQQVTLLGFGTRIGRLFTMHVAVPIGGAYMIHKGFDHLLAFIWRHIHHYEQILNWLPLAFLLYGVVNQKVFRRDFLLFVRGSAQWISQKVYQPLWQMIHSHIVQVILHNRFFRLFYRLILKPAIWTLLVAWFFPLEHFPLSTTINSSLLLFCLFVFFLNSRLGRTVEETTADKVAQSWHRYGLRLILGVFWWMVDLFKSFLETVDRLMYSIDEWFRFKSGDSRYQLAVKSLLGMAWGAVAYVVRFCVNLLIEPQINPIKHFPVVTVSHKLLFPLIHPLGVLFSFYMEVGLAYTTATLVIWCIPGVFGFLVWELKENWRLYAANRPLGLRSMIIGQHGESMSRLLKPGFHSGTIPKLFTKLRRAERRARKSGDWSPVRKHLHGLEHVKEALLRQVERDFLPYFFEPREHSRNESKAPIPSADETWSRNRQKGTLLLKEIEIRSNRVLLSFIEPCRANESQPSSGLPTDENQSFERNIYDDSNFNERSQGEAQERAKNIELAFSVVFEVQSGWLIGSMEHSNSAILLSDQKWIEMETAIFGLFKTTGTELIREQIEAVLPPSTVAYGLAPKRMRVWPEATFETEVDYLINDSSEFLPEVVAGSTKQLMPTIERSQILFREQPILWSHWVSYWNTVCRKDCINDEPIPILPRTILTATGKNA